MALVEEDELSRLAEFLVRRACEAAPPYALANFLYWYAGHTLGTTQNSSSLVVYLLSNYIDSLL